MKTYLQSCLNRHPLLRTGVLFATFGGTLLYNSPTYAAVPLPPINAPNSTNYPNSAPNWNIGANTQSEKSFMELKAGVQEIEEHPPDYARSTHNILKTFRNKFKNFSDPAAGRVVDLSDDQEGGGDPGGLWNADYGGVFSHIMASILADELSHHRAHCAHKKTFVKISGRVYYWDPTSLGERTRRWIDFEKQGRLGGACRILPFYKHKPGGDPGDGILGGGILLPVKKGAAPLFRLLVVWRDASSSGRPESELTGLGLKHHPPGPDIKAWGVLKLNEKHHAKFYYKEGDTIIAGHVTLR